MCVNICMLVGKCVSLVGIYAKDLRVSGWESVCVYCCVCLGSARAVLKFCGCATRYVGS